ncbi:MAG TPA: hypothetical protein DCE78_01965 [Bacteroidetes bacterium]|nr:hypothetical protein [Bacteroidota bacterium]
MQFSTGGRLIHPIHELADILQKIVSDWLSKPNESGLDEAIDKTISEGFFEKSDVDHALNNLSLSVQRNEIIEWVFRNTDVQKSYSEIIIKNRTRKILCLHAGNLPLVGLQDMLAVLVSGVQYCGKVSRKDPYLIPSLLRYIQTQSSAFNIKFSLDIRDFRDELIEEWMFAGSEDSLESLKSTLEKNSVISTIHRSLIRIAHFSVAVIDQWDSKICADLIESIFRYGGKGCRSVAVVYSYFKLNELSKELIVESSKWIQQNGYPIRIAPAVQLRSAYNEAIGINQVQVGNALFQEGLVTIDDPGIIYWQPLINPNDVNSQFGHHLQQVYYVPVRNEIDFKFVDNLKFDTLQNAQSPPIWWQPDGIDVLKWILSK